jgi:hypothetical protein
MSNSHFNVYQDRFGTKYLSGPFANIDHAAAYGAAAEQEPDAQTWIGKIEIDVSGEMPVMTYKAVL